MYIELVVLDNAVMDALILRLAAAMGGKRPRHWKTALFSLMGGGYAACSFFWPELAAPLMKLATGLFMALALPFDSLKSYLHGAICLFLSAFLAGGLTLCAALCLGGTMSGGALIAPLSVRTALLIALALTFAPNLVRRMRGRRILAQGTLVLTVKAQGRTYTLPAMVDSGSTLREPLSGKPVIAAYLPELAEKARIPVPYATVDGTGFLYAFQAEEVRLMETELDALIALTLRPVTALVPPAALPEQLIVGEKTHA